MKIKKGDLVKVIAGDDKGKTGKVLVALKKDNAVLVSGINLVKKAVKNKEGKNFESFEKPVHISNVKLESTEEKKKLDNKKVKTK